MIVAALYYKDVQLCIIQAPNDLNTVNVWSILPNILRIRRYASIVTTKHVWLITLIRTNAIINAHDLM